MIRDIIANLVVKKDLTTQEAHDAMNAIMSGECTDAQIAGFLIALRMKGETVDEITGCAKVMREKATRIPVSEGAVDIDREDINIDEETIIDTCGTGGSGTNTFNISTATAFVVAAGGVKVAKHGNRAASSTCGSADVLEKLGINLKVTSEKVALCVRKIGIGFLFAPMLHSAMRYAIGPRKELGTRTVFNVLGPLTNPAGANAQVLGVYAPELTEKMAGVLKNLGTKRAFVVHGSDALDEITITGNTRVSELNNGRIKTYDISPEDFGLPTAPMEEIRGGNADINAGIVLSVLGGGNKGAARNIVLLNAAFAFLAAGKVKTVKEGVELAAELIDSQKAIAKLQELIKETNT